MTTARFGIAARCVSALPGPVAASTSAASRSAPTRTSTEVSWSHLHLLVRPRDKLVPILTVRIDESTTDKTKNGGTQSKHWTVHMARTTHHGSL